MKKTHFPLFLVVIAMLTVRPGLASDAPALRVTKHIGSTLYLIEFTKNAEDFQHANAVLMAKDGKWITPPEAHSLPAKTRLIQTVKDGRTFAFEFKGLKGYAYSQVIELPTGQKVWQGLPAEDGKFLPITPTQMRALISLQMSKQLQSQLDAQRINPSVNNIIQWRGTAYQRFYSAYTPVIPKHLPPKEKILARTGFQVGPRGTYIVLSPTDPNRPALVITSDEKSAEQIQKTTSELQRATTTTLMARKLRKRKKGYVKNTRAGSILVAIPGKQLSDGIDEAAVALQKLPQFVAANSVLRAYAQAGDGPFRSASQRTEAAAAGGLGAGRFEGGLYSGTGTAIAGAQQSIDQTVSLIVEKTKWFALKKAAQLETRIEQETKRLDDEDIDLKKHIGFEIDFMNKRKIGIEYQIVTTEGRRYVMQHLGKNFAKEDGPFVPRLTYGSFNATIIEHYTTNGSITEQDLVNLALPYGLFPTSSAEIHFAPPEHQTEKTRAAMQALYADGKIPSQQQLRDAFRSAL